MGLQHEEKPVKGTEKDCLTGRKVTRTMGCPRSQENEVLKRGENSELCKIIQNWCVQEGVGRENYLGICPFVSAKNVFFLPKILCKFGHVVM